MSKTGLKSNDKGWIQKFQLTVTEFIQSLGEDGAVQKKYGEIADSVEVFVIASHVIQSCDCGNFSVVYSCVDHINTLWSSSPIMHLNRFLE